MNTMITIHLADASRSNCWVWRGVYSFAKKWMTAILSKLTKEIKLTVSICPHLRWHFNSWLTAWLLTTPLMTFHLNLAHIEPDQLTSSLSLCKMIVITMFIFLPRRTAYICWALMLWKRLTIPGSFCIASPSLINGRRWRQLVWLDVGQI